MSRVRSPNYPSISLPEAINRVKIVHAAEQHLAAPKEVIAKHLGYNGMNGASMKLVSAIIKYGLLEDAPGDKMKVSMLALRILHPTSQDEKRLAIFEAAYRPALFTEIASEWEGASPSDENLKAYLVRRGFALDAIDRVIRSYRETTELVAREKGDYLEPVAHTEAEPEKPVTKAPTGIGLQREQSMTAIQENHFQVSLTDARLEITASVSDSESIDKLIQILQANKPLMPSRSAS